MRDTSDAMEDSFSEDTRMECEEGSEDLVDLVTDDEEDDDEDDGSSRTIRDAAERLLTLLGVEEDPEEFDSSSEDEGVELDGLEDEEEEEDEEDNARLLHQLAASLAKELKQQSWQRQSSTRLFTRDTSDRRQTDADFFLHDRFQEEDVKGTSRYRDTFLDKRQTQSSARSFSEQSNGSESSWYLDDRLRVRRETDDDNDPPEQIPSSWSAGWDACAAEALRYLLEDEGLPPSHPTVLAMKDHLEMQRKRAFTQCIA